MRRSRNDIIYDILKSLIAQRGMLKPTRLLYKANLSHSQMKEYMAELESKQLVALTQIKKRPHYQVTDEGYVFFQKIHKIREMSDALGI